MKEALPRYTTQHDRPDHVESPTSQVAQESSQEDEEAKEPSGDIGVCGGHGAGEGEGAILMEVCWTLGVEVAVCAGYVHYEVEGGGRVVLCEVCVEVRCSGVVDCLRMRKRIVSGWVSSW